MPDDAPPIITAEWIARAYNVPPWVLGVGDPPPRRKLTRRERVAARIGQGGWNLGHLVMCSAGWAYDHAPAVPAGRAGRLAKSVTRWGWQHAPDVASRVTDAGDWLAELVVGR